MNIFQKVTLKTLKENKTRTIVTIIGIILSLSMFTAVTTSISSFQNFMLEITKLREGDWHGSVRIPFSGIEEIQSESSIEQATFLEEIGYSKLEGCYNQDKPYLYICGLDEHADGMIPILLSEGRLPENDGELLLPEHLSYNGGITHQLGDTLSLNIGDRISDSKDGTPYMLGQETNYLYTEAEWKQLGVSDEDLKTRETESWNVRETRSYTVVGFYKRPAIENYSAPGYTALTKSSEKDNSHRYLAYLRFKNPKDAIPWMNTHYPDDGSVKTNSDLLRTYAASYERSYNQVLYGLGTILIVIILFGSISLIHNAFSISVTERTKQFGLLASLGATKKQLVHSVLFEAFFLCIIGIPLGILAGIVGIGITFSFVGGSMADILYGEWSVPLSLHVTPWAILAAALIGLFTVLISAYLPARRCTKLSPMEAIRLTADINIRPGKVRTFRLTYRLFGLSGMLASKNFKRNRKKYRATVLSLFVSIVLFISASSFCSYLTKSVGQVMSDSGYDIMYYRYDREAEDITNDQILTRLSALDGIEKAAYRKEAFSEIKIPIESLSQEYLDYISTYYPDVMKDDYIKFNTDITFVDDNAYEDYLTSLGLSIDTLSTSEAPAAIASDFLRVYISSTGKFLTMHLFREGMTTADFELLQPQAPEGYRYYSYYNDEKGDIVYYFENIEQPDESLLEIPSRECTKTIPMIIGSLQEQAPYYLGEKYTQGLTLIYPISAMETVMGKSMEQLAIRNTDFYFITTDHKKATADISQTLKSMGLSGESVIDKAEEAAQQRTIIMIITIFSYGFIILISLISVANVFNTISTNIHLRKREFAMLKSTGLSPKGFRIMMCYECLLYGLKGLLYGLPVSILITYWIFLKISDGLETSFYIPWPSLVIAIGSVFLVVGCTMIYSMHKIGKENIMDILKNENA